MKDTVKPFIRVRDALALGDDFRGIFRFVARADAAPFVNHMALFVCQYGT